MRSYEISQVACTISTKGIGICLLPVNSPNIVRQEFKKKIEKVKESGGFLFENELFIYLLFTAI